MAIKRQIFVISLILPLFLLAGCPSSTSEESSLSTTTSETTSTTTSETTSTPSSSESLPVQHTISFEENGGSAVTDITADTGTAVNTPTAPTKTGYTFVGWYADSGLTTLYAFTTMPNEDITVYAKWAVN